MRFHTHLHLRVINFAAAAPKIAGRLRQTKLPAIRVLSRAPLATNAKSTVHGSFSCGMRRKGGDWGGDGEGKKNQKEKKEERKERRKKTERHDASTNLFATIYRLIASSLSLSVCACQRETFYLPALKDSRNIKTSRSHRSRYCIFLYSRQRGYFVANATSSWRR